MRVLVDARLAARGLGIATTVDNLCRALVADDETDVTRWQGSGGGGRRAALGGLSRSGLFDLSPGLDPRARPFDVIHYMSNVVSARPPSASVFTIHDVMFLEGSRARDRAISWLFKAGAPRAGALVCNSERSLAHLRHASRRLAERAVVIPWGRGPYTVASEPRQHLLAFGGRHARKRSLLLCDVYGAYCREVTDPLPLVVLARAGLDQAAEAGLGDLGATIVSNADGREVARLLRSARALILTSRQEGFGLPLVEAGEMGTPVVLGWDADIPSEVLGRHCIRTRDTSLAAWVAGLHEAMDLGPVENALDLPAWEEVARQYRRVYQGVTR